MTRLNHFLNLSPQQPHDAQVKGLNQSWYIRRIIDRPALLSALDMNHGEAVFKTDPRPKGFISHYYMELYLKKRQTQGSPAVNPPYSNTNIPPLCSLDISLSLPSFLTGYRSAGRPTEKVVDDVTLN